ncbi:CLUMA_CG004272, isoform A [Clunio marinus]|uniref:CLUMA_CG004272, isoform A n=1 Tax=Clunio marinus TaxID=568069 RepID=A0A1J1HSP9_9DIPT|nr:CLUMA_CG004272, isoform A [Clunio marinus]
MIHDKNNLKKDEKNEASHLLSEKQMADKNKLGEFYTRPAKLGKWEGFKQFLWNSETSECLGRTGGSWAKILFFYVIFYTALAGFFAAMLLVFYQTLDENKPKWQLEDGLIGSNPGLGFRPMPPDSNVESTLVWFESDNPDNTAYWIGALNEFLSTYTTEPKDPELAKDFKARREDCTGKEHPTPGNVCKVDLSKFGPCVNENAFGYSKKAPCVFLKLNKIFNWMPLFYNKSSQLPDLMPADLQDKIRNENLDEVKRKMIWISCEGENPADIENLGPISYLPAQGFPAHFYPFTNDKAYMPPILAIHFERPKTGVLINIECKAWARNIHHDRQERRGSVHFELMVD